MWAISSGSTFLLTIIICYNIHLINEEVKCPNTNQFVLIFINFDHNGKCSKISNTTCFLFDWFFTSYQKSFSHVRMGDASEARTRSPSVSSRALFHWASPLQLLACLKGVDKHYRPRSSLIRIFTVCYSVKHFVNFIPDNDNYIENRKRKVFEILDYLPYLMKYICSGFWYM